MKIQPSSTPKSLTSKSKKATGNTSSFDALFSTQIESESAKPVPENHVQSDEQHQPSHAHIEQTLHELEDAISNLRSGVDDDSEKHQLAQDAINNLRQALTHQENITHLSAHDIQEAETLLAVEAKRLEALDKYK